MPAKPSLTASISLHPRDGILPDTVGKLREWVGKQQNVVFAVAVTEPNANGSGRHLHLAIGFKKPLKVSDDYKDRLRTALREELSDPDNWGRPSIVCKAHHDPAGLVGGYFEKDEERRVEFQLGTLPSPDELRKGAERRDAHNEALKKLRVSKNQIPNLFKETHFELIAQYTKTFGTSRSYTEKTPTEQVEECYQRLILTGYTKFMMELSEAKLNHFVKYWKYLIASDII